MGDRDANTQTQIIERDLEKLGTRFDRHLEIYAQNGKELSGLKTSVDGLRSAFERHFENNGHDQKEQWAHIKLNSQNIQSMEIKVAKIAIQAGIFSALGSAAATGLVVIAINRIFL